MRGQWFLSILALFVGVAVSACASAQPITQPAADTAEMNEATFIATEYAYEGPQSIPGGWSRLTLNNQGKLAHDLMVVKLDPGKTLDDVMTALEAEGPPEWAQLYGGVTAQPGQSESYVVDLTPGNYVLLSFGESEDGPPDAAQGMIASLTVTEAQTEVVEANLPQADAEINMADYTFIVNKELEAGEQMLRVDNTGKELHELVIYRLKEGKTMEDFQAALEKEMNGEEVPEGELPMEDVAFMLLSPNVSTYNPVDFEPGKHIFICHIPSPEHEMQPHFSLGMIQEVDVKG
jgi:hypothetical protein